MKFGSGNLPKGNGIAGSPLKEFRTISLYLVTWILKILLCLSRKHRRKGLVSFVLKTVQFLSLSFLIKMKQVFQVDLL